MDSWPSESWICSRGERPLCANFAANDQVHGLRVKVSPISPRCVTARKIRPSEIAAEAVQRSRMALAQAAFLPRRSTRTQRGLPAAGPWSRVRAAISARRSRQRISSASSRVSRCAQLTLDGLAGEACGIDLIERVNGWVTFRTTFYFEVTLWRQYVAYKTLRRTAAARGRFLLYPLSPCCEPARLSARQSSSGKWF
jgi:hypothetical protein